MKELDNDLLINVIDDKSTNDKNDFNCNKDISFYIENSLSLLILKCETLLNALL